MAYTPSTEPESISQTLSRSWDLYRLTFLKAFLLALLISILEFLPRLIDLMVGYNVFAVTLHYNYFRLLIMLFNLIEIVIFSAILWHMQNVTLNKHESLSADFRTGLKKLPAVLAAAIIQLLIFFAISLSGVATYILLNLVRQFKIFCCLQSREVSVIPVPARDVRSI